MSSLLLSQPGSPRTHAACTAGLASPCRPWACATCQRGHLGRSPRRQTSGSPGGSRLAAWACSSRSLSVACSRLARGASLAPGRSLAWRHRSRWASPWASPGSSVGRTALAQASQPMVEMGRRSGRRCGRLSGRLRGRLEGGSEGGRGGVEDKGVSQGQAQGRAFL